MDQVGVSLGQGRLWLTTLDAQFTASLAAHGVPVVHVDWRPPAGGDTRLASLLERLR